MQNLQYFVSYEEYHVFYLRSKNIRWWSIHFDHFDLSN